MISGMASARTIRASICLGFMILGSIPTLGATTSATNELSRYGASAEGARAGESRTAAQVEELSAALPMSFEPNVGQADTRARFVARSRGYGVFLTDTEAILSLPISRPGGPERTPSSASKRDELPSLTEVTGISAVRMRFDGARPEVRAASEEELPGKVNYLRGSDPEKWQRDVPTFARVRYEGIYEGIDAVFYGTQQMLEYDVVVHPGADPSLVRLRFDGQDSAEVTSDGDLVLGAGGGQLRHLRPGVFQQTVAGKRPVSARYELDGDGALRFAVGEYDRAQPLVIDPGFVFSTTIGAGRADDEVVAVAVDSSGAAFVAGETTSFDFPTTPGAFQTDGSPVRNMDVFVAKIAPSGGSLVYATYLAGTGSDEAADIHVDAAGNAFVGGRTSSMDFPTTPGSFDTTPATDGYADGFVSKLNATGTALVYSTYLSGSIYDGVNGISLATDGSCIVVGETSSADFPVTAGAFDTVYNGPGYDRDAFISRIDATGANLSFSTFLGGFGYDVANDVATDASGIYVCGATASTPDFPVTAGAFDTTLNDLGNGSTEFDAFAAKFSLNGSSLLYASYLGGFGSDIANSLVITSSGEVCIGGTTDDFTFPRTANSYSSPTHGATAVFVTRFTAACDALVYSALLGGTSYEECGRIAMDPTGAIVITGTTQSANLPTTPGAFDRSPNGSQDGFVARLSATGSNLEYGSFVGTVADDRCSGITIDASGRTLAVGFVGTAGLATTPGAIDGTFNDGRDGFVIRFAVSGVADYCTLLGGSTAADSYIGDSVQGVTIDGSEAIIVSGTTFGLAFPVTPGSFDETIGTNPYYYNYTYGDAFVSKLTADGQSVVYSTYLGGLQSEFVYAVASTAAGEVVVGGQTQSDDFPTSANALSVTIAGEADGFVAKLSPNGDSLVFGTYIGGARNDEVFALAVDGLGRVIFAGYTRSPFFPTTLGAFDTSYGGYELEDGFVAKLAADGGSLTYSTFLGGSGSEFVNGISVDQSGSVYAVGSTSSPNFPTTPGAFSETLSGTGFNATDAFVAKLSPDASSLTYGTFYGGSQTDTAASVAVDPMTGIATLVGQTESADFPTSAGAFDSTLGNGSGNGQDAFVVRLNAAGSDSLFSTYLGGDSPDSAAGVALDSTGRPVVVGTTYSPDFPTSPDAADAQLGNGLQFDYDGFAVRLTESGATLAYGTFVGGSSGDTAYGLALAADDTTIVVGRTTSFDFFSSSIGSRDAISGFIVEVPAPQSLSGTSAGVYSTASGAWFLRNSNTPGGADVTFSYGPGGTFTPIVGDWDGDGDDTAGIYDPATGAFFLRNTNGNGGADLVFTFGAGGAGVVAFSGDWNGDGTDTIGLYVVATGVFFLRNSNSNGPADTVFTFGAGGAGIVPLAGDWNGDGADTIGLYVEGSGTFFLRNANAPGGADLAFSYGPAGAVPSTGDWNGDGSDTVGIYVPATGAWFLRNANSPGSANVVFSYGPPGATPIVGNWDGI